MIRFLNWLDDALHEWNIREQEQRIKELERELNDRHDKLARARIRYQDQREQRLHVT